jgi:hypothetical protein
MPNVEPITTPSPANKTITMFANNYHDTLPFSQWDKYIDGVFIFKEIVPSSNN